MVTIPQPSPVNGTAQVDLRQAPPVDKSETDLRRTISPSRLALWHQCRLRFFFRHIVRIEKPLNANLLAGRLVHGLLQEWNRLRWKGQAEETLPDLAALAHELLTRETADQEIDWAKTDPETLLAQSTQLVQTYLESEIARQTPVPQAVEVWLETALPQTGITLQGILDCVAVDGSIIDYKTAASAQQEPLVLHQHQAQLVAYALLYRACTGTKEHSLQLHCLIKTKTPKVRLITANPVSDRQIQRFRRLLHSYVQGLESEDFVPSPGFHCAGCEFFDECRAHTGLASS